MEILSKVTVLNETLKQREKLKLEREEKEKKYLELMIPIINREIQKAVEKGLFYTYVKLEPHEFNHKIEAINCLIKALTSRGYEAESSDGLYTHIIICWGVKGENSNED